MKDKETKKTIIEKFKQHPGDTGSSFVQIALVSERISYLSDHLKKHTKDFHSRRGLLLLVGRRRRLLSYLKKKDPQNYTKVLKELKLKK
ncbi:MAG: 30S ribosomal protein S15 [Candidatus Omnitrophica bacterium]|nr:30S ribosomal protein S15 [Candidatus Omnitrophota bacterium]